MSEKDSSKAKKGVKMAVNADGTAVAGTVTVEQTGSPIRRPAVQRKTLAGLGLNKMHRRRTLQDTPAIRGMIARVRHLVRIVDEV